MAFDRFGRKIHYLRISLTDHCNLNCIYCKPEGMTFRPTAEFIQDDEILLLARLFSSLGFNKVRFTGGEPLMRENVVKIVQEISCLPGIHETTMTTNGVLLPKLARPLAEAGLKRINISLDSLDPAKYERLTRGGEFEDVWEGILAAEEAGLTPVKINAVILRGYNEEDIADLARLTIDHPWQLRFLEMMPIFKIHGLQILEIVTAEEMFARVERELGTLIPVNDGQLDGEARLFHLNGALGDIGFISSISSPFCATCTRARLTADGILRMCLLRDLEVDLLTPLRQGASIENLRSIVLDAIWNKPWGHGVANGDIASDRPMNQIGG